MSSNSKVSDQAVLSVASNRNQGQGFGLVRLVSGLVGLGLVAWGFRRKRSWLGRSVGTFGASLVVRSLGDGPLASRLAAFVNTRGRMLKLKEIAPATR